MRHISKFFFKTQQICLGVQGTLLAIITLARSRKSNENSDSFRFSSDYILNRDKPWEFLNLVFENEVRGNMAAGWTLWTRIAPLKLIKGRGCRELRLFSADLGFSWAIARPVPRCGRKEVIKSLAKIEVKNRGFSKLCEGVGSRAKSRLWNLPAMLK